MTLRPTTYEEIQQHLQRGSPLRISSSSEQDSVDTDILSLEQFNSVLLYEPEEMIIRVQAGITLAALAEQLRLQGQWIPTLVAEENLESTLGAAIANDNYHPRAATLGALRTTILGGTFVAADGTLFKSGSRVVKSVAGYDIHRSFCGSKGKFGAIVDVTLKVQPFPENFLWFTTEQGRLQEAAKLYPTVIEAEGSAIFCELAGFREDIEQDRSALSTLDIPSVSEREAHDKIREIIRRKTVAQYEPDSVPFDHVRKVFDPKGVLR